jgi:predicted anti-sigma-YlaC factor YlaD
MNVENDFTSYACSEYEAFLEDYLDGALDNAGSRKIAEHLKVCAGCTRALEDAAAASQLLRAAEPVPDPGPAFARIVMARIRAQEDARSGAGFWEPFVSLAWKFATTAAFALVVMLAYSVHGASNTSTVADFTASTDVQDMLVASQTTVPATRSEWVTMVTGSDNGDR